MQKISYAGYRFPPEIIEQAIWLYLRFTLSFRDVEDLLAERGIMVSYETVRRWVDHFGPMIAADLRKRRPKPYGTWHLDEVYLKIAGRMVYLWRAVDAEEAAGSASMTSKTFSPNALAGVNLIAPADGSQGMIRGLSRSARPTLWSISARSRSVTVKPTFAPSSVGS
jgi:hypothetical protein